MTVPAPITDQPAGMLPLDIPEEPGEPFGVIALPTPDAPVTDLGIQRAYAALLAHYRVPADVAARDKDARPVGAQLDKALRIAQDRSRWTLHADHMAIIGSAGDRYRTTPAFCEGPAWTNRGRRTNACKGALRAAVGMCTHQLAIELLRLAQHLDQPIPALTVVDELTPAPVPAVLALTDADPAPALVEIARAELEGWDFYAQLGRIRLKQRRSPEDVTILLSGEHQQLDVCSGAHGASGPAAVTGGAYATLAPDEFAELWSGIGDAVKEIPALALTVAVDDQNVGLLTVRGGAINLAVAVNAMPV